MSENYFEKVVLPSVGVPNKPTYNMAEVAQMLDCSKMTVWRRVKQGFLNMTKDKKFYRQELVNYFSDCVLPEDAEEK